MVKSCNNLIKSKLIHKIIKLNNLLKFIIDFAINMVKYNMLSLNYLNNVCRIVIIKKLM